MELERGTSLGHYEIEALIGAGGMGRVYRARDTKLGREVAIKVLPEEFARDKERLDRFEREARLLAALNHPNIATLQGMERSGDVRFLVMELVEGLRGPEASGNELPVDTVFFARRPLDRIFQGERAEDYRHRSGLTRHPGARHARDRGKLGLG